MATKNTLDIEQWPLGRKSSLIKNHRITEHWYFCLAMTICLGERPQGLQCAPKPTNSIQEDCVSRVGFLRPLGHGISLEEVGMGINYSMGIPLLHLVLSLFPKK